MRKTLEDLCPDQSPEEVLLDYARVYFSESDWPATVILAVLALENPGQTFAIDIEDGEEGDLYEYDDAVDVETGWAPGVDEDDVERELAELEARVEELKGQLARA
jgi:hypothetical protein